MHFPPFILFFLLSRYYLFLFETRSAPSPPSKFILPEMCVWSTENMSKHTVTIYFWKKKKQHTVQREYYEPTVSYVIYTEVSYKSLCIDRGKVLYECVDNN